MCKIWSAWNITIIEGRASCESSADRTSCMLGVRDSSRYTLAFGFDLVCLVWICLACLRLGLDVGTRGLSRKTSVLKRTAKKKALELI